MINFGKTIKLYVAKLHTIIQQKSGGYKTTFSSQFYALS